MTKDSPFFNRAYKALPFLNFDFHDLIFFDTKFIDSDSLFYCFIFIALRECPVYDHSVDKQYLC